MYATTLHCSYCGTDFPQTNLGSCTVCATPGEESAFNETLGVNGEPVVGDFRTIPLKAHTLITLAYQSPGVQPDRLYNRGDL